VFWFLARRSRVAHADIRGLSRLTASTHSVAATVAPSVRIAPATTVACARVSRVRAVLSAADRDSVVGAGPSCAVPMRRLATRPTQHVADAQFLGHRPRAGGGREQAGRHQPRRRPGHHRARRPAGTSGTPTPASRFANSSSGGAHTRTSVPSARNRTASPTSGSTSLRDPIVDNNTRASWLPFPQVLASGGDSTAQPGSCRKPPGALYAENGEEWVLTFPLIVRCGRTTSSRSGGAPRTAVRSARRI